MDEQREVEQDLQERLGFRIVSDGAEFPTTKYFREVTFPGDSPTIRFPLIAPEEALPLWKELVSTTLKLRGATEHEIKLEADLDSAGQSLANGELKQQKRAESAESRATSAEATVRELREALVLSAEPLEAIRMSVKWELCDSIKEAVIKATDAIRRALLRADDRKESE